MLALQTLYYRVIAAGDSHNDTTMLAEADAGILFSAPANGWRNFPSFLRWKLPAVETYAELKVACVEASACSLTL